MLISLIVRRVLIKKAADFAYNLLLLQTKFRIVELKNEENIPEDKAYINITQNEMINSCHSLVGKTGSINSFEIGGCSAWWMILHEFVHALGIFFSIAQRMYNCTYYLI